MINYETDTLCPALTSDSACVSYLFHKRWPHGFKCFFCGSIQKEMSPASTVVCRYCRKQSSITAHTLMHGSKKSLVAWMLVAWQFCLREQGMSARELQRLMELSCYQTAWSWLQKMRQAAAVAESAKCRGTVFFDSVRLSVATAHKTKNPEIGFALELKQSGNSGQRVRFMVHETGESAACVTAIRTMIETKSIVLLQDYSARSSVDLTQSYSYGIASGEQRFQGQVLLKEMESWLNRVYRKAIDVSHLQCYLDEFSFRHNTSTWQDHLIVFDHLVAGLVSPMVKKQGEYHGE